MSGRNSLIYYIATASIVPCCIIYIRSTSFNIGKVECVHRAIRCQSVEAGIPPDKQAAWQIQKKNLKLILPKIVVHLNNKQGWYSVVQLLENNR